jgi:hypothetical protein
MQTDTSAKPVTREVADAGSSPHPPLPLRPRTPEALAKRAKAVACKVRERQTRHELRASRWSLFAAWTRLIVALAATLSTISVFTENEMAALGFSLSTAIMTALNAAFTPSTAESAHRAAAKGFSRCFARLDELLYTLEPGGDDSKLTKAELCQLSQELVRIEAQIESVSEAAPPDNCYRKPARLRHRGDTPTTARALLRYRRTLLYASLARRWKAQYEQPASAGQTRSGTLIGTAMGEA